MAYLVTFRGLGRMMNALVDEDVELKAKHRAFAHFIRTNTSQVRAEEYIQALESQQVSPDELVVIADPVAYHNEITLVEVSEVSGIEFYSYTKHADSLEIAVLS